MTANELIEKGFGTATWLVREAVRPTNVATLATRADKETHVPFGTNQLFLTIGFFDTGGTRIEGAYHAWRCTRDLPPDDQSRRPRFRRTRHADGWSYVYTWGAVDQADVIHRDDFREPVEKIWDYETTLPVLFRDIPKYLAMDQPESTDEEDGDVFD